MNKWRLLLFSIFALLHITTSERPFIDGRYRCYDHSPRILPSDKSFSAYEINRERRFLPAIRQLNTPDNYPNSNLRDTEIVRLSRRWQIRDIKQHSRDENRQTISPSVHIRHKRDVREQNFVESTSESTNDLRSNLRHNRLDRNRDAEYQRNIRTTSLSRVNYRKQYATRTPLENRDVNRYSNIDRDILNTHDNNRDQTRRQFSDHDELNTQRFTNSDAMRTGFNHVRYIKTNDRYIHEEPDLRYLRTIRSERANDNKLSNDRNSRLGMQRDLYEDLSQGESRNDRRNNLSSLDRMDSRENKRRFPGDSQTNKRSLVRDIANLNSLNDQKRSARVHNRAVHIGRPRGEHRLALHETSRVLRTQRGRSQPFDRVDINGERENRLRTRRGSSEEMYLLRVDRINTRSQIDRRNGNNNPRSTRDTVEKESLANREVRDNFELKMNRVNINSKMEMKERQTFESRFDSRNVNTNARSTRNTNGIEISENRKVRENVGPKINHVNMNSRLQLTEHETVLSRLDRRNVNNNARSSRNTNKIEISENREVRDNVGPKMNRVNMNSRLEIRERETGLSRLDRRNVNNNAEIFRNTNEREISENREVRENFGPKMNRVNMNSRLEIRERETGLSRLDRRNVNNNAKIFRNTNEREISENREVRDNVGPKMNRVNMNSRLEIRERETGLSRLDRRNVNNNAKIFRNINEREISENREVRENVGPKMNRVNMNSRLEIRERETGLSRLDRRNVNNNAEIFRNTNEREISKNREVRENFGPKMNSRLEMRERETVIFRPDRRNANNNARSTRNINEKKTSEKREVRDDFGLKMNRLNMNSRLETKERETVMSRIDRRNVNSNARSTRNTNEIEISENREVRENVGPKMNRVNMNSRLKMRERETMKSRFEKRNVNSNARSTRNINEMETSENRELRDVFGHKMNRVNMNIRLEMKKRDIRYTNENMIIVRRRQVERDLYRDNTITVRRNVPSQEFRVNELRRSERIQRSINDATNTMSRRTREALSLSPENRIRYDARRNLRESQYVRSRENHNNVERVERQRSYKHEISNDRIHINNIQRRVQIRASERQDENRITYRNDRNFASGIHISKSTTENDNRQQSRNVIDDYQLSNRRHEIPNARDERRQTKMTQVDTSNDMRRLATVRYDEDNEKPISVQKLQYEYHDFEMKWQYLFYALQTVYIFSIIMKMPNSNQENKHTKWISTWFTPTKYLKMD